MVEPLQINRKQVDRVNWETERSRSWNVRNLASKVRGTLEPHEVRRRVSDEHQGQTQYTQLNS